VGPRAGLDAEVRLKILCLGRRSNSGHPDTGAGIVRNKEIEFLRYKSIRI
jgi:hypothetical protein